MLFIQKRLVNESGQSKKKICLVCRTFGIYTADGTAFGDKRDKFHYGGGRR